MMLTTIFWFTLLTITVAGQNERLYVVRAIDSPAGPSSAEPNLVATADGRVFLSWIEAGGEKRHALRFSMLQNGKWSEPRTISTGDNWFVNWADFPSLAVLRNGSLVAHWLVKAGAGTYAYNVNAARSSDLGKTWSRPIVPHRDGTPTEHGFVSMMPLDGARTGVAWLDGRNFTVKEGEAGHSGHGASKNEMTLRYATIGGNHGVADEALLDPRVCECCQTSGAMTSEGPVIVYRDRSPEELRDISIVRLVNGHWTTPQTVHPDGWRIEGCPVNGPSISADRKRIAVAWFTAAKDTPRVNVVFSTDAGASFGRPVQVDDGNPMGRVQALMLENGSVLVCWLERTAAGGAIKARLVRADGSTVPSVTIAETSVARASGFPRMARGAAEIILAWTETGNPSRVRVAALKLSDK